MKEIQVVKKFSQDQIVVLADENMLVTSLRNIISNAIKFNQAGGKIFIRAYQHDNKTVIEVEDTGIGMSPEKVNELFSYKKGSTGKGAGIGLILAKEFLDKNDAELQVKSETDRGTRFIISI